MRSRTSVVCAVAVCVTTMACVRHATVRVVMESSTNAVLFRLEAPPLGDSLPPIDAVVVDGGPMNMSRRASAPRPYTWFLARRTSRSAHAPNLHEVHYGELPPGFTQAAPPLPLFAGWYTVEIRAGWYRARTGFEIDSTGHVHQTHDY